MRRKLVAVLACRNTGSRLFGKPLQNLNVKTNYTILDNLVGCLKKFNFINDICLGISVGDANKIYINYANQKKIKHILGNETNVLSRLIKSGLKCNATDVLRISSESPFLFHEKLNTAWIRHKENNNDFTTVDHVIDGIGFEIISLKALKISQKKGKKRHRSELCTLFIRENLKLFKCEKLKIEKKYIRKDLRLTVDNPEDLILCRAVYQKFSKSAPLIQIDKIINFLDKNKKLIQITKKFTSTGYKSMNIWKAQNK